MATRKLLRALTLLTVLAGCEAIAPAAGPDTVRGSIYTDLHVGRPCDPGDAPRELVGIGLRFRDASGAVLATALTNALTAEELAPRPGAAADDRGCRYAGQYEAALPVRPSYTVDFDVPDPPERGGYFSGTDELTSTTISREDLEHRAFTWCFGLPPSYVVP